MSKRVILTKLTTKGKTKKVVGDLLQDALDHLKVVTTDKNGVRSIKSFKKSQYVYKIVD